MCNAVCETCLPSTGPTSSCAKKQLVFLQLPRRKNTQSWYCRRSMLMPAVSCSGQHTFSCAAEARDSDIAVQMGAVSRHIRRRLTSSSLKTC